MFPLWRTIRLGEFVKPIEIHVEGYKIVISEDDKKLQNESIDKKDNDDSLINCPKPNICPYVMPYIPPTIQPQDDWWRYPYVTWTNDDNLSNIKTTSADIHPVRDIMTGKDNHEEVE